jgi:hypothetical protein
MLEFAQIAEYVFVNNFKFQFYFSQGLNVALDYKWIIFYINHIERHTES